MGAVYAAQDPQLDRKVAVKVLRHAPLIDDDGRQRLIREAQAMAKLSHPNVVEVYDVGLSEVGVYIAMALIDGDTLGDWLRRRHRTAEQILDVCIGAGRGVAAAHAAGFVHRDLKPSNILVASTSAPESFKGLVVDFGLARASTPPTSERDGPRTLDSQMTDRYGSVSRDDPIDVLQSPLTEDGFVVGTPAYMAPEQRSGVRPSPLTDQYSFCVTVFEALFGHRPDRPPPATGSGDRPEDPQTKTDRRLRARVLPLLERGLDRAPDQRFPAMVELLEALEAAVRPKKRSTLAAPVLGAAAVAAAVMGYGYARHAAPVADCSASHRLKGIWDVDQRQSVRAAFAAIPGDSTSQSWTRIARRLDDYASAWTAAYSDACEATHVLGDQSDAVLDLRMGCLELRRTELQATVEVLNDVTPETSNRAISQATALLPVQRCNDVSALLADVEPPAETSKAVQVEALRAQIQKAVVWMRAGKFEEANELVSAVLEEASTLGYPPIEAEARVILASVQYGLRDIEGAMESGTSAYRLATEVGHDVVAAQAATEMVFVLTQEFSRFDEALQWSRHARAALDRRRDTAGQQLKTMESRLDNSIGVLFAYKGDHKRAGEHYRRALEVKREVYGDDHLGVARIMHNIGQEQVELGELDQALVTFEDTVERYRAALGVYHPDLMVPLLSWGGLLEDVGQLDRADALNVEVLAIAEASVGLKHPVAVEALSARGRVAAGRGDLEQAVVLQKRALELAGEVHRENLRALPMYHAQLGATYSSMARWDEAHKHFEQAFTMVSQALGDQHPVTANLQNGLGETLVGLGRFQEAQAHLENALHVRIETLGKDHLEVAASWKHLAGLHARRGDREEALRMLKLALGILRTQLGEDHPDVRATLSDLGDALLEVEDPTQAAEVYRESLAAVSDSQLPPQMIAFAQFGLAKALVQMSGDRRQALELADKSLEFFQSSGPPFANAAAEVVQWKNRL